MKKFLFAAAALFTVSIYAATPVARYDFEYIATLDVKGKGKAEAVPGVKGKAVQISNATITIPAPEKLTPASGTIVLWIKPVNWDDSKPEFVFFLQNFNKSKKGRIILYKYAGNRNLGTTFFYGHPDDSKARSVLGYPKADMSAGKWFCIAATWDKKAGETALYFNGKKVHSKKFTAFYDNFGDFILNPPAFRPSNPQYATCYDMLQFYNEALTPAEIAAIYASENPEKK